ncbi:MAG: hypothetical protein WCY71_08345 [Halothiobacillaceae bacterium]
MASTNAANPLPQAPTRGDDDRAIKAFAEKYIWWISPEQAAKRPLRVIAQVMTLGTFEDMQHLVSSFGEDTLRRVIEHAEAGWFNGRSWAYWHYRLGLAEVDAVPPLPTRRFA